jgi:hypothetical protein
MSFCVCVSGGGRSFSHKVVYKVCGGCYLPWELERAVHRIGKMFPERCEQQRAVIAHPKVARALHELADALLARLERIGGV